MTNKTSAADYQLPDAIAASFTKLRAGARELRQLSTDKKNRTLSNLADKILKNQDEIIKANALDLARLTSDATPAFRDRLTLNPERIAGMVESLRQVAQLPDPVNEVVSEKILENGLKLKKIRAPLGVIFMIFESRPNVILEAFSLAFKSGNAIAQRGGSESSATANVIYKIVNDVLSESGFKNPVFYGIDDYDRQIVAHLLKRKDWIDITVPRGGEKLIEYVTQTASMPIIKNDRGLCHIYVEADADLDMAIKILVNAKTQRPGVCNAAETVLVHENIAQDFLTRAHKAASPTGLRWKCDESSAKILKAHTNIETAESKDWDTEHLDLILNCRIVKNLEEAMAHIEKHGSRHSECIITKDEKKARLFQSEVDAAAVYWNASTRFTDGFSMGLGGELGISTQKLHVRGPVGLYELTTPRWIADGTGQTR